MCHEGIITHTWCNLTPDLGEKASRVRIAPCEPMNTRVDLGVIVGCRVNETIVFVHYLVVFHHHNANATNARALEVGGFKVNRNEIIKH